jgi:hypothetical protein
MMIVAEFRATTRKSDRQNTRPSLTIRFESNVLPAMLSEFHFVPREDRL